MKGSTEELHHYLQSILTYFFLLHSKNLYTQANKFGFFSSLKLNLPSCLIPKLYVTPQILLTYEVKVTAQYSCSIGN